MLMNQPDPKDMKVVTNHHTCDYHKRNPGVSWAGCTCGGSWGYRTKTAKEKEDDRLDS